MIGDAVPHEKNDEVNKDKIDWEEELELLIKDQVKVSYYLGFYGR